MLITPLTARTGNCMFMISSVITVGFTVTGMTRNTTAVKTMTARIMSSIRRQIGAAIGRADGVDADERICHRE